MSKILYTIVLATLLMFATATAIYAQSPSSDTNAAHAPANGGCSYNCNNYNSYGYNDSYGHNYSYDTYGYNYYRNNYTTPYYKPSYSTYQRWNSLDYSEYTYRPTYNYSTCNPAYYGCGNSNYTYRNSYYCKCGNCY